MSRSSLAPLCHPLVTTPERSHYQNHQERERAWQEMDFSHPESALPDSALLVQATPAVNHPTDIQAAWNALKKHLTSRHPRWLRLWICRESVLVQWYRDRAGVGWGRMTMALSALREKGYPRTEMRTGRYVLCLYCVANTHVIISEL